MRVEGCGDEGGECRCLSVGPQAWECGWAEILLKGDEGDTHLAPRPPLSQGVQGDYG